MDLQQNPGAEPHAAQKELGRSGNLLFIVCGAISMAAGLWIARAATDFLFPEPWLKPGAPYHPSVAWLVRDFPEPRPPQNHWDIVQDVGFAASWLAHELAATVASVVMVWPGIVFGCLMLFTGFLCFFVTWRLFVERIYDGRWPAGRAS